MTVAELEQRLSSRELSEWMVFYELEPFGPEADDVRHAISTASIVNSANGIEKSAKPQEFRLMPEEVHEAPSPDDLLQKFKSSSAFRPKASKGTPNVDDRKPEHSAHDGGSGHQNPDQNPA